MGKRLIGLATVIIILLGCRAFYCLAEQASRGGNSAPLYSARRYDPYGTAALRELFARLGTEFRMLERPCLAPDDKGLLVQVLPLNQEYQWSKMRKRYYKLRTRDLKKWIADGNTVMQFTRQSSALMKQFGIKCLAPPEREKIQEHQVAGKFPDKLPGQIIHASWCSAARTIMQPQNTDGSIYSNGLAIQSPTTFTCKDKRNWQALASFKTHTIAGVYRYGNGRLIVVGAPTPTLNMALGQDGNLDFILGIAGQRPVILDEWSHGVGHAGTIMELLRKFGLLPAVIQLAFIVLIYTWSTRGHRRLDDEKSERAPSSIEQVVTLGHLYDRVLTTQEAIRWTGHEALRRVAKVLHCTPELLASGRVILKPEDAQEVESITSAVSALNCPLRRARLDLELAKILTRSHAFVEEKKNAK